MFAIEERPEVADFRKRLLGQLTCADRGVNRILRVIDRSLLVEVGVREIQGRVTEYGFADAYLVERDVRTEDRNRLRMTPAIEIFLHRSDEGADICDEAVEAFGGIS